MLKRVEGAGLIRGFQAVGSRGVGECVSHFLFADDTILFCDADVEQILHVRMLLLCFQAVTGLKVRLCLFWVKITSGNAFLEMRLFGWSGKFYFPEIEIR